MLSLIATPTWEFIARRDAVCSSWTVAERKHRALVAHVKQYELLSLLGLLPEMTATTHPVTPLPRSNRASLLPCWSTDSPNVRTSAC
jgi:hypothetical protein